MRGALGRRARGQVTRRQGCEGRQAPKQVGRQGWGAEGIVGCEGEGKRARHATGMGVPDVHQCGRVGGRQAQAGRQAGRHRKPGSGSVTASVPVGGRLASLLCCAGPAAVRMLHCHPTGLQSGACHRLHTAQGAWPDALSDVTGMRSPSLTWLPSDLGQPQGSPRTAPGQPQDSLSHSPRTAPGQP